MQMLREKSLIHSVPDVPIGYLKVNGRNAVIDETPYKHKWANLLGLTMITRLGLSVAEDDNKHGMFTFTKIPQGYFILEPISK